MARTRVRHPPEPPEIGTLGWPGGADLDPDVLYSTIRNEPIELAGAGPTSIHPMRSDMRRGQARTRRA